MGNLADLGLGDIFQIVSLSRRSGSLQLTTPDELGEIVFIEGKVVAAGRAGATEAVGEALMAAGLLTATGYQELLAAESTGVRGPELLASLGLPAETLDAALEQILTRLVNGMFDWTHGTFSFLLEQDPDVWRDFSVGGARVVLRRGLNPRLLVVEAARLRDERKRGDPFESFMARDAEPQRPAPVIAAPAPVVDASSAPMAEVYTAAPTTSQVEAPPAAPTPMASVDNPAGPSSPGVATLVALPEAEVESLSELEGGPLRRPALIAPPPPASSDLPELEDVAGFILPPAARPGAGEPTPVALWQDEPLAAPFVSPEPVA